MVSENTVKIDLTHAFSSPEPGVENFSKSYIPLISKRIVINNKTLEDYRNLYVREKISLNYMERFKMIPNGVYIKDFDNRMIKNRFNNFIFGYIGRFAQEKRPELFLELTKMSYNFKCRAKMITNRFDLSISDYANLVLVLDVTDPSRIRKELSAISVLLITSEREGFPLVIMEAMELGIPVISTNVGSIKEHVINGFNGFLYRDQGYDEESFLSFCHQKIELMGNNQELYTELCLNAREYAEKNFNIVNMHKAYRRLLLNE